MIVPMFQPLHSTKSRKVVGGELLCRWLSDGEMLLPHQFPKSLSWAQVDIEALSFMVKSNKAISRKFKSVYINLSKEIMESDLLFSEWERKIKDLKITEKLDVSFEVLEWVTDKALHKRWPTLASLGGRIVIDDFGCINSNLSRLEQYPWSGCKFNIQKIAAGSHPDLKALNFCLNRGITTIAEKVETSLDATLCANKGIHLQQGYYYGKASPLNKTSDLDLESVDLRQAITL